MNREEITAFLKDIGRYVLVIAPDEPRGVRVCIQNGAADWKAIREFEWPWEMALLVKGRRECEFDDFVLAYIDNGETLWLGNGWLGGSIGAKIDIPLFDRWKGAVKKLGGNLVGGYLAEDLQYSEYEAAPINTACFFWTGGNGVHINLLDIGNGFNEDSPVLYTDPSGGLEKQLVARNLEEFLLCYCEHGAAWCGQDTLKDIEEWVSESIDSDRRASLNKLKQELLLPDGPSLPELAARLTKLENDFQHRIGPSRVDLQYRL